MKKALINYFILQIISYLLIIFSILGVYYFNLNNLATTTTKFTRNDLIIRDFKSVQFNIDFSKLSGFESIEVFGSNGELLLYTGDNSKRYISLNITKNIYIGPKVTNPNYKILFKIRYLEPVYYSLIAIFLFSLLTMPYIFFEKRRVLVEVTKEKERVRNEEIKKMALQLFHDIRAPLAALNTLSSHFKIENSIESNLLEKSIQQMNEMANALLLKSKNNLINRDEVFDIVSSLKAVSDAKNFISNQQCVFNDFDESLSLYVNAEKIEIERMFSNLINNAIESSEKPRVKIKAIESSEKIEIVISDNGVGIPDNVLKNMGKSGITTKENGNGLGLSHAYNLMNKMGNMLEIESSESGTTIKLYFKKAQKSTPEERKSVLIDDDELTRMIWKNRADKKQIELIIFKSVENFLLNIESFDLDTNFYIDNFIGNQSGVRLAEKLYLKGYGNLYIETGTNPDEFKNYTFIKGVLGKQPPF